MGRNQKLTKQAGKDSAVASKYGTRLERASVASSPKLGNHKTGSRPRRRISRESVAAHALDTFGSAEKVRHWMNRPNPLFHGKTPAQVIQFDLVGVEAELVRIDHGVYM
jgi:uncharacterized protein (DUF2384 family)